MQKYILVFALTISQAWAHDNLETDGVLSVLAKPKLAVQIDSVQIEIWVS